MTFQKGHAAYKTKKEPKPTEPELLEVPFEVPTETPVQSRRGDPVFDHTKQTVVSVSARSRNLEQDGNLFTFAEWNRETGKYEPEPKFVPRGLVSDDELRSRLSQYIFKMSELEMSLRNFQEVLLRNLEIMKDGK